MADDALRISYRFVPMGTAAPRPAPTGELWLDVGSRADLGVLDHHGGDTRAWSAAQLVLERHGDLVPADALDNGTVTLVTHEQPDLDAVCASWLLERLLRDGDLNAARSSLEPIVEAVGLNDQGLVRTTDPLTCWPIVAREALSAAPNDDAERLTLGHRLLDQTLAVMEAGGDLADAATKVCDPEISIALGHALQDYLEDLDRAMMFRARLPVRSTEVQRDVPPGPVPVPTTERRWSLVDGIVLDNPVSSLFKEIARGDSERSHGGHGFPLLVVCRDSDELRALGLQRHIISVDPLSGLCLEGLGSDLERLESSLEDDRGGPTLGGRQRPAPGAGRHGYDATSPWYDGRGHGFTIVDSPGVQVEGHAVCGSQLTDEQVLDTVWAYSDPARFVRCQENQVLVARPVRLEEGWEELGEAVPDFLARCPSLLDEVRLSLEQSEVRTRPGGWLGWAEPGVHCVDDLLWVMPGGHAVWLGRFQLAQDQPDLRTTTEEIMAFRQRFDRRAVPGGAPFRWAGRALHCVQVRVRPDDVALREARGASAQAFFRLAAGRGPGFDERTAQLDLERASRRRSRDRRVLSLVTDRGACVVSTRRRPLREELGGDHPAAIALLCGLVAGQRAAFQDILSGVASHVGQDNYRKQQRQILADRRRVLAAEQQLVFERVTDSTFGEAFVDDLGRVAGVPDLIAECRQKVEVLADYVRDRRADFYQRVGFWISFLFGPLIVTAGLFGGTQQVREFGRDYVSFVPSDWPSHGWIYFGVMFLVTAAISGLVWTTLSWIHAREDRRSR